VAAGGAPVGYDAPVSPRTRLARFLTVLVLVAAVGSQVGPWGPDLRRELGDRVEQVVGGR
jgi:hypothetical protein